MGAAKKKRNRNQTTPPPATPPRPAPRPSPAPATRRRPLLWIVGTLAVGLLTAVAVTLFRRDGSPAPSQAPTPVAQAAPAPRAFDNSALAQYAGSASCRECHAGEYEKWHASHHGLAERNVDLAIDRDAFTPDTSFQHGSQSTRISLREDKTPVVETNGFGGKREAYTPSRVIGVSPLRQFLVPTPGDPHRLQTLEATYDPHKDEWFNVYGGEDRKPGEWGHWTGRGMNWNAMCAACHNTRLLKNYDPGIDSYRTVMAEMTVGCEACHGPMKDHVEWQRAHPLANDSKTQPRPAAPPREGSVRADGAASPATRPADPTYRKFSPAQVLNTCGSCHSRRSEITGDYVPGEPYHDHHHLAIPDHSDLWYPDGQVRDEDYEYTSFLSSRMHFAGVRCTDCHDPHAGKTILPGNALCMRCHTSANPDPRFKNVPVINPVTHTNHAPNSAGSQCINCHMPQTVYMQRHPRHDHGFTIPDPLLTKQHNVPNACNRCHTDKDVDWAIDAVDSWYGEKMNRPTRTRAQWIARARAGDAGARDPLVKVLNEDPQSFWRSVGAAMLGPWASEPPVTEALLNATRHEDPLLRENAVRSLSPLAQQHTWTRDALTKLLEDPSRNVRVRAAWALRDSVDPDSRAGRELAHFLDINSDQPTGAMQRGEYLVARNQPQEALTWFQRAVTWDPNSPPIRDALAYVFSALGRSSEALEQMKAAVRLAPNDADYHYRLGLAYNEVGRLPDAVASLQQTVRLNPRHPRAWYNLGLAYNAVGKKDAALAALQNGESVSPGDPDLPYARATILAQMNRREEARAAARKALQINPAHTPSAQLLQMLR